MKITSRLGIAIVVAVIVCSLLIGNQILVSGQTTTHDSTEGQVANNNPEPTPTQDQTVSSGPSPPIPVVSPPFTLLLNGSATYPSYMVSAGQQITLVIQINSSQPVSLDMSATQQTVPGTSAQPGIVMALSTQSVSTPTTSEVFLHVSIGNNVSPATYPMAVDAFESGVAGHIGFQAGFNLIVQG